MSEADPLTRLHVSVRGQVQGVGFRWYAKELADSLGLTGWVRNREDGSVELEAEGRAVTLDDYVVRLRTGNPSARVDAIDVTPAASRGGHGFEIRS
ncbi:MAG: acylphosphatase [Elusimicrobia bacterium]|nr:acylphosphatase [Elusimicrobiota bacterium]